MGHLKLQMEPIEGHALCPVLHMKNNAVHPAWLSG